jgi:hypothetical protein
MFFIAAVVMAFATSSGEFSGNPALVH